MNSTPRARPLFAAGTLVGLLMTVCAGCGATGAEPKMKLGVPGENGSRSVLKSDRSSTSRFVSLIAGNLCAETGSGVKIDSVVGDGAEGQVVVTGFNLAPETGTLPGIEEKPLIDSVLGAPRSTTVSARCGATDRTMARLAVELRLDGPASELVAIKRFRVRYAPAPNRSASQLLDFGIVVCPNDSRSRGTCMASWESPP